MKNTKKALLMSAMSLLLCVSMLVGTTFAWFTDSVSTGMNTISAGNLDVDVYYGDPADKQSISGVKTLFDDVKLWEPGAMAWEQLTVANLGSLALKYTMKVNFANATDNGSGKTLADILKVAIMDTQPTRDTIKTANLVDMKDFALNMNDKALLKGASDSFYMAIYWEPSANDNEFNMNNENRGKELKIDLGINLVATQYTKESDSFDEKYDMDATYPALTTVSVPANTTAPTVLEVGEVAVELPADIAEGDYTLEIASKNVQTDDQGKTTVSFDINLLRNGVKVEPDGTTEYAVEIEVGKNLDVTAVTHKGEAVDPFYYDPLTGIVSFETASFSPFAVIYEEADGDTVFLPEDEEIAGKLEDETKSIVAVDEEGNEYATITEAVKSGASKLYFKEGVDLGTVNHLDVTNDLTIFGNGAYISGGERDLAVDIYKPLTGNTTITVYNLHGIAVWGNRTTEYDVNVNLYNCEDLSRVYISGQSGKNNINLVGCTANKATLVGDTVVYSNANGSITLDGCTITEVGCPVNLNHKVAGEQTVTVKNSTFTDCATEGTAAYYAPIRLYNSVEGANQTLTVSGNTFTYSEGKAPVNGADVLLNKKHNDVDATGTIVASVQADATTVSGANVTLTHTVANKAELYAVAAYVNQFSDYSRPYVNETVLLVNDIDLGGEEWTPIGDYRFSANRFCGTFDGDGKTISNFKISKKTDKNDSNKSSYGFFGNMEGTVKDLTIDGAQVCSYAYVGALVGRMTNGAIINCHVKNSNVETTYWQAGGMIGQLNDSCTVKDSTITNTTVTGASAIGGMFGPLTATNEEGVEKNLLFENCTVKDCAVVQKGSFGAGYDVLFGAMFCDIDVADNVTNINKCTVVNTTLKGEVSAALFGTLSGTKVYFDGNTYLSDGLYKAADGTNTYAVSNANGLETLHAMMADKTAGRDTVINLTADIDYSGKTWTPVDSHADTAFEIAEINGNGHTLSNLTVNGQAMFTRFAGTGDVTIKDITFDNATVNSTGINVSILTVQTYQNVLLDNVDVKNSSITGAYKVAPLIGSVYNESSAAITATLKNCDVSDTTVTATGYDFCTAGMVAFVYEGDNDKVEFENCTVTNVKLYAPNNGYTSHAWVYVNDADTDDCFNEVAGVTVTGCTFENN